MRVVAEGVETEEHARIVCDMGCDYLQGYLYSKAVCAGEIPDLISRFETGWLEELQVARI